MKDNPEFTKIYAYNKQYMVEMLKAYLADNHIESFVLNQQDSSYLFGDVELYVRKEDEGKAKELVKKFENDE